MEGHLAVNQWGVAQDEFDSLPAHYMRDWPNR